MLVRRGARRLLALLARVHLPVVRSGGLAIADQGLVSCANFLTALLVGRAVEPAQFGVFAVTYTLLWVFQNGQKALIVEPMNVLGATKEGEGYRLYVGGSAVSQVAVALGLGLVLSGLSLLIPAYRTFILAFALAAVAFQLQEFVRRIFFTRTRVATALWNDIISYGGRVALLTGLYLQSALSPTTAMLAIALAAGAAVVVGAWQARSDISLTRNLRSIRESAVANWRFGRWLLGANLLPDLANRFNAFFLLAVAGPAAVGTFTAPFNLTRVNNMFIQSFDTALPPMAARRFRQGSRARMERFLSVATVVALAPVLALLAAMAVFPREILHLAYGGTYDEFGTVLRIVSLWSLLLFLSTPLRVALKAMETPRILFIGGAVSTAFLVTGGAALIALFGVTGAAWSLALSAAVNLGIMIVGYWRADRTSEPAWALAAQGEGARVGAGRDGVIE